MNEIVERTDMTYRGLLEKVPTIEEAIKRTHLLGGMEAEEVAYELGILYNHFTRMVNPNDSRQFPPGKLELLMRKSGNFFVLDWLERRMGRCAYPLEMIQIIDAIRASVCGEDKTPRFSLEVIEKLRNMPWP